MWQFVFQRFRQKPCIEMDKLALEAHQGQLSDALIAPGEME
jgi:hypothetical protein